MPKKRAPIHFTKPVNPIHPSLTPSSNESKNRLGTHSLHSTTDPPGNSVNDKIHNLRLSQAPSNWKDQSRNLAHAPTVHPSLKAMLQVQETPSPKPRFLTNTAGRARARGPAGPPPPSSWLNHRNQAPPHSQRVSAQQSLRVAHVAPEHLDALPDLYLPPGRSLMFQALKALAINWEWHLEFDRYYLATLPTRLKQALLWFISNFNQQGITRQGLETLFLDDTVIEDATDSESLTHIDLSNFICKSLDLKDLKEFLANPRIAPNFGELDASNSIVPDTWDAPSTTQLLHLSTPRFPSLTHLSLSHPTNASWKSLLSLAPHLTTLTHLSLAFWPAPSLNSNPIVEGVAPSGNSDSYDFGKTLTDEFRTEAAEILRHFSRKTYCLKWLDLTGCCAWIGALRCEGGVDWVGSWRGVNTVKVGPGWVPEFLEKENINLGKNWNPNSRESQTWELTDTLALADWLHRQHRLGELEEDVNALKLSIRPRKADQPAAAAQGADGLGLGDNMSEMWWEDSAKLASRGADVKDRGPENRVTFDRGWKGWRIEDAIKTYGSSFPPSDRS